MSKFLVQENRDTFNILTQTTDIPGFRTNLTIPYYSDRENKIYIPIADLEATLNFYAVYDRRYESIYNPYFERVKEIDWAKIYRYRNV